MDETSLKNNDGSVEREKVDSASNGMNACFFVLVSAILLFIAVSSTQIFTTFEMKNWDAMQWFLFAMIALIVLSIPITIYFYIGYSQASEEESNKKYYYVLSDKITESFRKEAPDMADYLDKKYSGHVSNFSRLGHVYLEKNGEKLYLNNVMIPPGEWLASFASPANKWRVYSASPESWLKELEDEFNEALVAPHREWMNKNTRRNVAFDQANPLLGYKLGVDSPIIQKMPKEPVKKINAKLKSSIKIPDAQS